MLKLLFAILISLQSLVAYSETTRKNPGKYLSFEPALDLLESNYESKFVLKGTDDPYTGVASITSSIWKDVVIKESFVDGKQVSGARLYLSKSTDKRLSGEFETYYPDGTKHGFINLIDGKQDGLTESRYLSGNLKSVQNYSKGIRVGDYALYYDNGNKSQTGVVAANGAIEWYDWNIDGYKEAFFKFNSKDSSPVVSRQWDSQGKKHGSWIERYEDGSMYKQKQYIHGNPEGIWTTWHNNGNKQMLAYFKRGLLHGAFKFWNKEGVLVVDGHFRNSKETGQWSFKDHNGNSIDRPKDFRISIMDGDKAINVVGHDNKGDNMNEIYISLHWTVALGLLILLPILGVGMCWSYRKIKKKG